MDHSRFIASLAGPILVAIAVSLLLNPGLVAGLAADIASSPAILMVSGMAAMLLGLLIVRTHNVWKGWPIAVTLFGWAALLGGAVRIIFPQWVGEVSLAVGQANSGVSPIAGGVALLIGLFFTWQGWFVPSTPAPTAYED